MGDGGQQTADSRQQEAGEAAVRAIRTPILFLNVLVIAACGLVYELLAGTVASYVIGDSVTQFSLIIGLYLSALGVGAWLSRFIDRELAARFVEVEIAVALIGGFSAPLLFFGFARLQWFQLFLFLVVFVIGVLVGLELPILMRILKEHLDFKELVSRVLSFDYLGSLFAAVLFPLFLVPRIGLVRTSILFGFLNGCVGLYGTYLLRPLIASVNGLRIRAIGVMVLLVIAFFEARTLTSWSEDELFADEIVYATSSPYQRIVVTRGKSGFHLFLNGNLQFSSADEYRYHEALVHPALGAVAAPHHVLILGGGDGLALREVLKYPSVTDVTLVDLDRKMTQLSTTFPALAELNRNSFSDPRVHVINEDAMIWLDRHQALFDAAIVDFPDPNNFALGKLYTTRFYRMLRAHLAPDAAVSVQCTSPLFARRSYWCIIRTMEAAGLFVRPYQMTVPSFGVWGFALARLQPFEPAKRVAIGGLRFLDEPTLATMFVMPPDTGPLPVEINRLDNQVLVRYYEDEWRKWS
ncbi:MAG TPA: polyamine aminopropyltransferase [Thermoanaerobaculia bacterium]|nr:polyamine aminopropyltransferase [Thermoanaerobaculia bacterium]